MRKMSVLRLALVLCPVLFLIACEGVEKLVNFKLRTEANFSVPSTIGVNTPFQIPTPDVKTNANQTFQNNKTNANKVKDISLETLDLTITSPAGTTFAPVKSIKIYISAEGIKEVLLASKENIPADAGATLVLDTTKEKLDDYVKKEQFNLRTEVVTRQTFFQDIRIKAQMTFGVSANL